MFFNISSMFYSYKSTNLSVLSHLCQCCYSALCTPWFCGHPRRARAALTLPTVYLCSAGSVCQSSSASRTEVLQAMLPFCHERTPSMHVSAFALRECHCSFVKRWHQPVGGTAWSLKKAPMLLLVVEGRSFLQSLSRTRLPSASINGSLVTWLIQGNCGDGGWGSVVRVPNVSQG